MNTKIAQNPSQPVTFQSVLKALSGTLLVFGLGLSESASAASFTTSANASTSTNITTNIRPSESNRPINLVIDSGELGADIASISSVSVSRERGAATAAAENSGGTALGLAASGSAVGLATSEISTVGNSNAGSLAVVDEPKVFSLAPFDQTEILQEIAARFDDAAGIFLGTVANADLMAPGSSAGQALAELSALFAVPANEEFRLSINSELIANSLNSSESSSNEVSITLSDASSDLFSRKITQSTLESDQNSLTISDTFSYTFDEATNLSLLITASSLASASQSVPEPTVLLGLLLVSGGLCITSRKRAQGHKAV